MLYSRGPQPPGHGPVPVCGQLGTRPHSSRWVAGERAKHHLYLQLLPIAHITTWAPPPVRSVAALDSHRNANPTVNCSSRDQGCTCLMRTWCLMTWGGAEVVMLELGSGSKYRSSLAERFDCTETIINQLLADSYQNPISEWQVKISSAFPLILHYGELYNFFFIYYIYIYKEYILYILQCNNNRNKVHNKCNVLQLSWNCPPAPCPWKNCLPQNRSLVPKRLWTAVIPYVFISCLFYT